MGPTEQSLFREAMKAKVFEVTGCDLAEASNAINAPATSTLAKEPKYRCIRELGTLISGIYGPDSTPTRDEIISQAAEYLKLLEIEFYKIGKVQYKDMLVFLKTGDQVCIQNMQEYFQVDVLRTAYLPENLHYGMYKDGRLTEEPKSQDEEELGQGHSKEIDRKEMSAFQKMGAAVLSFFWTVYAYLFHGRSLSEARPDWSNGVVAEKHATSKAHIQSDEKSRLSALGSADMLHTSHIGMPPRFSIVDGAGLDHSQGKWRDKSIDSRYRPPSADFRETAQTGLSMETKLQFLILQRSRFVRENEGIPIAELKRTWNKQAPERMSSLLQ